MGRTPTFMGALGKNETLSHDERGPRRQRNFGTGRGETSFPQGTVYCSDTLLEPRVPLNLNRLSPGSFPSTLRSPSIFLSLPGSQFRVETVTYRLSEPIQRVRETRSQRVEGRTTQLSLFRNGSHPTCLLYRYLPSVSHLCVVKTRRSRL